MLVMEIAVMDRVLYTCVPLQPRIDLSCNINYKCKSLLVCYPVQDCFVILTGNKRDSAGHNF